jgi:hypothetical protein
VLAVENRRDPCHQYDMAETLGGGIPIIVVSFPGVRGKQRWVAAVPLINEMVAEVRKRIPADAIVELSDQRLSPEQAAKLNIRLGDVRCID